MSTNAQTQAIPRVPAGLLSGRGAQVAPAKADAGIAEPGTDAEVAAAQPDPEVAAAQPDAEVAAPGPDGVITRDESIRHMYEAGLAKLDALHDRWAAAMAEIREAQVIGGPGRAAA